MWVIRGEQMCQNPSESSIFSVITKFDGNYVGIQSLREKWLAISRIRPLKFVLPPPQKRINPFVFTHPVAATGFHTNAAYYTCRLGKLRGFQTYAAVWAHYCSRKMRIQVCVPSTWISFWYPRAIKLAEFCTTKCNLC